MWKKIIVDGQEEWLFECRVNEELNNGLDNLFFWGSMIFNLFIWGAFMTLNILTLSFKTFICFIPISLTIINLGAFVKCSKSMIKF